MNPNPDTTTTRPAADHPLSRTVLRSGSAVLLIGIAALGGILFAQRRALSRQIEARRRTAEAGPLVATLAMGEGGTLAEPMVQGEALPYLSTTRTPGPAASLRRSVWTRAAPSARANCWPSSRGRNWTRTWRPSGPTPKTGPGTRSGRLPSCRTSSSAPGTPRQGKPAALVVDATGHTHLRPLVLGEDNGQRVRVLRGLQAGERVVLNPPPALGEGTPVRLQDAGPGK